MYKKRVILATFVLALDYPAADMRRSALYLPRIRTILIFQKLKNFANEMTGQTTAVIYPGKDDAEVVITDPEKT